MIRKVNCNENESNKLSAELKKELEKLNNLVNKLETNIGTIQKGEIWNGPNAYESNKSLVGYLDHDKTLLSKLEKCSDTLESAIK